MPRLRVREGKSNAVFVLAHGAGAGSSHPWMVRFAEGLAARGITTVTFDFPYMAKKKKMPDRADVLEAHYREVVLGVRHRFPKKRLSIGGKSMGGRIASQLAAKEDLGIKAFVFFGYPLHPPGKPERRRDEHLPLIRSPMLFIQGERDALGGRDEIAALAKRLHAEAYIVPHGDHSLVVPKKCGLEQPAVEGAALDAAARFVRRHSR